MSNQPTKLSLSRTVRLLRYGRPYRRAWVAIVLLTLLTNALALLAPWPMLVLVDHVLGTADRPPLLQRIIALTPGAGTTMGLVKWIVAAGLILFVLNAIVDAFLTVLGVKVGQRMVYDLCCDLFDRIQRRSLLYHTRHNVGDLLARVTGDSWCVHTIVDMLILSPARALIMLIFAVAVMLKLNWQLTLAALVAAPLMAGSTVWLASPIRLASKLRREIEARLLSHVQQTLAGIPIVQAFAQEAREEERFRSFADAAIGAHKRSTFASQFHRLGTGLISTIGTAFILLVGVKQVLSGTLTLGAVLLFIAYLGLLHEQMRAFAGLWASLQNISANIDRVSEVLESPGEVPESPHAVELRRPSGDLQFERVTYGYEAERPVLRDLSLHVPQGSTVAVVGSSGAGKSTLAGLVLRFFDPWSGRILLDGNDLRDLKVRSLRRHISIVLQESFLFPMTVAQNIAYGRPEATREQIEAAARAAGADGFIRELPDGYDTVLAERGASLSGGERQRIAIARALLTDAPLLILDEPTSSLDSATEAEILHSLQTLMKGRTTLVIAHRLSTIRNADQIVVLDGGAIAEYGTHDELLELGGIYADMYARQSGQQSRLALVGGNS